MSRSNSGLAVLERYGTRHFAEIGRKGGLVGHGGRPRSLTLTEALQATRPNGTKTKKEETPKAVFSQNAKDNGTGGIANMSPSELRAAWQRKVEELEMGL